MIRTTVFHKTPEWMAFSKKLKRLVKDALRLGIRRSLLGTQLYTRRRCGITKRLSQLITEP
jgi:hypothetical protein